MHTSVIRSRVGRASCTKRNIFTSSRRNFIFAHRNLAPTPWFVDEGTESSTVLGQSDGVNRKNDGQTAAVVQHSPPPSNTPDRLRALHAHLITLPLLDSVSVVPASRRLPAEASLPTQRPHGKRKRGGSGYGGDGVGDPSPIWDWVLEADVKEGAEKRGAVQAVLRSATKAVGDITLLPSYLVNTVPAFNSWPRGFLRSHSQQRPLCAILMMAGVSWI